MRLPDGFKGWIVVMVITVAQILQSLTFRGSALLVNTNMNLDNLPATTKPKTIFITAKFGIKRRFQKEVAAQRALAEKIRYFDEIYAYDDFPGWILNNTAYQEHLMFYTTNSSHPSKRGGGYWFWKAELIVHHMEYMKENDWVVFADADLPEMNWFTPTLIEYMRNNNATFALDRHKTLLREWAKGDVYQEICPGRELSKDGARMMQGGYLVIQKTPGTLHLMQEWRRYKQNYQLLSDEPSKHPNNKRFREHRHDQAILSMLIYCRGTKQHGVPSLKSATNMPIFTLHI